MTAINIILQSSRALIMSDTVGYSPTDGIPHSFHRKCVPVPGQITAVCTRGDVRLTNAFAQAFSEVYASIDDGVADDFSILKDIYEIHLAASDDPARIDVCDVIFAGWSQAAGTAVGHYLMRREAWQSQAIDPVEGIQMPALEGDAMLAFVDQPDVDELDWSAESFEPGRHGVILMEAQRRLKFQIPGLALPPMNLVGGKIQLTTLTERGIVQEDIHDWHDRLGVAIKPKPYASKAIAPIGLNRQQRRAWERQHGKVAA